MADAEQATGETAAEEPQAGQGQQQTEQPLTLDAVKKLIQSETDRVRTEYSRKLKEVETEKEELQKERMSEKERADYELKQREKRIAETQAELAKRELALERANVIREMEIPKTLADFVDGKDRDDIISNARQLMTSFSEAVQAEVNRKLASSGAKPQAGDQQAQPQATNIGDWHKAWGMPPGPEKDAVIEKLFGQMAGMQIPIQGEG